VAGARGHEAQAHKTRCKLHSCKMVGIRRVGVRGKAQESRVVCEGMQGQHCAGVRGCERTC